MKEFILHIDDAGNVTNKSTVRNHFGSLLPGKYRVRIDQFKQRTLSQNAYYWATVVPLVKLGLVEAGYNEVRTNEDAHEAIKHLFLKREIKNDVNDIPIIIARSTTELTTTEFNAFLEQVWQWAAQYLSVQIPQPNEQLIMFNE